MALTFQLERSTDWRWTARQWGAWPRKAWQQMQVLRRDPQRFGHNLLQFSHPELFHERLVDVLHARPMHVRVVDDAAAPVRLNVLDAGWTRGGMTGGPNTVINLALRVAQQGMPVRLVSTVQTDLIDPAWLRGHAAALLGGPAPELTLASAGDAARPMPVTPQDVFLATHWVTAQQLGCVLPRLRIRQFFYMLQEFEAGFYAWSSNYAGVIETLGMDFWPIVNEALLADYLFAQPLGRLNDPETRRRAMVFEPAVDAALFHPPRATATRPRRLLFYARPTNARNMFGLGLLALRRIAADPAFDGWEFLSIGSKGSVPDLELAPGRRLRRAPWVDYAGYGELLREADVLLCPMMSPHTSYPVLEMAACGGLSVTNVFATKTAAALSALSDNIVAAEPTVEGLAAGALAAARRVNAGRERSASLRLPRAWSESLDGVAAQVRAAAAEFAAAEFAAAEFAAAEFAAAGDADQPALAHAVAYEDCGR